MLLCTRRTDVIHSLGLFWTNRYGSIPTATVGKHDEAIGSDRDFRGDRPRLNSSCSLSLSRQLDRASFRLLDCSGRITFEEFHAAMKCLNIVTDNVDEVKHLFRQFDTTNNGQIDLNEFLQQLRPAMNERRHRAALNVFRSMDVNKDDKLTLADLKVRVPSRSMARASVCSFQIKYAAQLKSMKKHSSQSIDLVSDSRCRCRYA